MKIATWNVNSIKVRLPHLLQWLADFEPDVVCLQELKTEDGGFPLGPIEDAGYRACFSGQKTYNGVAILARSQTVKLDNVIYGNPVYADEQKRLISAQVLPAGKNQKHGFRVLSAYFPNGQEVGSVKYDYKLSWIAGLCDWLCKMTEAGQPLVLAGDFNIAPEDRDVHDPAAWAGKILCSEAERAAFRRLLGLGLVDGFRLFEQPERVYSWWDYRQMAFRRNLGLRIDHILVSAQLAETCRAAGIDKAPRKLERPSDHAPAWVELETG